MADPLLQLLLSANQLKRVPRMGWMMRGVSDTESVADHSYGVAVIALILAGRVDQSVDVGKLLTMALIHDLPEAILSDIPSPASAFLPSTTKRKAEVDALVALTEGLVERDRWQDLWAEYAEQTSVEGRLVHDADRLDMLLQAYVYEQTTGNRWLEEFWAETAPSMFACDVSRRLFAELCEARQGLAAEN